RETLDVAFVSRDRVVVAFHTDVSRTDETQRFARTGRVGIRVDNFLKRFQRVVILHLQVESARQLKNRVRQRTALRIAADESLVMKPRAGEVAVELVDRSAQQVFCFRKRGVVVEGVELANSGER